MSKEYCVSYYGRHYSSKPTGKEIMRINYNLKTQYLDYKDLAQNLANKGCTFCPATFEGSRKNENFKEQQLFVIDIDDNASYTEMKERADRYDLPVLFAYRTFSWTPEKDKFRLVFALDTTVTDPNTAKIITAAFMKMFSECDESCKDLARMFYGSNNGLHYLAEEPEEINIRQLFVSLALYMCDRYDEAHYTRKLDKFYQNVDKKFAVKVNGKAPVLVPGADGLPVIETIEQTFINSKSDYQAKKKGERRKTKKVDFDELERVCRLFSDFRNGKEYYYYPQLFHIALNMICMDKGKSEFMRILDSPQNKDMEAYHKRDWKVMLSMYIDYGYSPASCDRCPYCNECPHYKNMILTVNQGYCGIKPVEKKNYCTLEEAERSLERNFKAAVDSDGIGLKLLIAQTGLGKTNMCLEHLKHSESNYILAVPTHDLAEEIYFKARDKGIYNIRLVPRLPKLSEEIEEEISHIYEIGAGIAGLELLRNIYKNLPYSSPDRETIGTYLSEYDEAINYSGHIIMTHERLNCLHSNAKILSDHRIIIDEDILRTVFSTVSVRLSDINKAIQKKILPESSKQRLRAILYGKQYQWYDSSAGISISSSIGQELCDISTNILDLLRAGAVIKNDEYVVYIRHNPLPFSSAVIMSATASAALYRELLNMNVSEYRCEQAEYKGKIIQYTNRSYSRHVLMEDKDSEELIKKLHELVGDDEVITFACIQERFNTKYHFGGIEGLNCLEGKNISVIGLSNVDDMRRVPKRSSYTAPFCLSF